VYPARRWRRLAEAGREDREKKFGSKIVDKVGKV